MRRVEIWAMRHGHRDGEDLTSVGRDQVSMAAQAHLNNITFTRAFHSNTRRTAQTAEIALSTIEQLQKCAVECSADLGMTWLQDPCLPQMPWPGDSAFVSRDSRPPLTVFDVMVKWPPAWGLRERFTHTLLRTVVELAPSPNKDTHILLATHAILGPMALPDARQARLLEYGEILHYVVDVDNSRAAVVEYEYLECPYQIMG